MGSRVVTAVILFFGASFAGAAFVVVASALRLAAAREAAATDRRAEAGQVVLTPAGLQLQARGPRQWDTRGAPNGPSAKRDASAKSDASDNSEDSEPGEQAEGDKGDANPRPSRERVIVEEVLTTADGDEILLLRTEEEPFLYVPIALGAAEALTIRLELSHVTPPRPLTMNLLDSVLTEGHIKVAEIGIEEWRDGMFISRIHLEQDGRSWSLDARPSDAVALALSRGLAIWTSRQVLAAAGIDPTTLKKKGPSAAAPEHGPKSGAGAGAGAGGEDQKPPPPGDKAEMGDKADKPEKGKDARPGKVEGYDYEHTL